MARGKGRVRGHRVRMGMCQARNSRYRGQGRHAVLRKVYYGIPDRLGRTTIQNLQPIRTGMFLEESDGSAFLVELSGEITAADDIAS